MSNEGDAHPLAMNDRETSGSLDDIDKPDRDVDAITDTLGSVQAGDRVKIGIGVDLGDGVTGGTIRANVVNVEMDGGGFDRRVSILNEVDGDGWGRLYLTSIGHPEGDPWEIASSPYHVPTSTADMSDFAAHGWVVGAEVIADE